MPQASLKLLWLTAACSPHHHDFLTALSRVPGIDLDVVYLHDRNRFGWSPPSISYKHRTLPGMMWRGIAMNPGVARVCFEHHDLFVLASYAHPTTQLAMAMLSALRKKWLLYGERPGINPKRPVRNAVRYLALALPRVAASGIIASGSLGIAGFRKALATDLPMISIPYLPDLTAALEMELQPPNGKVNFLFCGQLIHRKGIDVLCSAADALFDSTTDAVLTIVGDGPERWRVERLRSKFGRDRILLRGTLPYNERLEGFRDAHVFVLPSRHDGWGVVVHEAAARGLPIIGTRATGAAVELVKSGENGWLIEPDNSEQLLSAMQFFVTHRECISPFGALAKTHARRLSPDWGAAEMARFAHDVTSKPEPRHSPQ